MEPSKRSQAVSDAIRTVFINSYDILQLSGQKSSAILAQPLDFEIEVITPSVMLQRMRK